MVYENNCHSTLLGPSAHEFIRVTRPYIGTLYYYIATDVYLRKYNKYIVYRDIFYGVAVDAYSVTIGDYETPGMELAPGFWVKNDDDNNNYDTRRIWAIIIY